MLDQLEPDWIAASVPGTAASAQRSAGRWSPDTPRDFDAEDGWWCCDFAADPSSPSESWLRFDGLATLAEVWLNGEKILESSNAFLAHEVKVQLLPSNRLQLRCAALEPALKARRPRPRWKTRLVAQQQLRWMRTSLLGRIPGWSPPVVASGPWRSVSLIEKHDVTVLQGNLGSALKGNMATVAAQLLLRPLADTEIDSAELCVGDERVQMRIAHEDDGKLRLDAVCTLPSVRAWWPHSHGAQPLYPVRVLLSGNGRKLTLDCGRTGFREVQLDTSGDGFALNINGVPVFCRGACWTTLDIATLVAEPEQLAQSLDQFRAAGFNLLRIGGTMVYESQQFYEACAERGILVWQDYCFANMDYPVEDPAFAASVREEARQFLSRTQLNPALCFLCGNSEIEQQVAMLGQPESLWRSVLFTELLPGISRELRPDLPYITSSPTGGSLPFQVDVGLSHYYGVGAYQRPLEDARRAGVRFTSECLAFANVPEPETLELVLRDGETAPHHPRWKARVPRDSGPGWDFDDVRDHYLHRLFGVDVARLRYANPERYLYLSRLVVAEVMSATMQEWRRAASSCRGALVWFWRDLWPGAGWGLVDSTGLPKSPYFALKRVCSPVALLLTDEGLNGLAIHAVNDTASDLSVRVELALYRDGNVVVASGSSTALLPSRNGLSWNGDALIGRFTDLTHAYRFGPPGHEVAIASLLHADTGELLGQTFHIPDLPTLLGSVRDPGLTATALANEGGGYAVEVQAQGFAYGIWLEARGYAMSDNYFHLAPGARHRIELSPRSSKSRFQAWVHVATGHSPVRVTLAESGGAP